MRNPGFHKNRTDAAKGQSFIKTDHRDLCVKINLLRAGLFAVAVARFNSVDPMPFPR